MGTIQAQDYNKQLAAFESSFEEKSVEPLQPYISDELKFDPVPITQTPAILKNIVTNLPKLNSLELLEASAGMAQVRYDFAGLGVRESAIHFTEDGKFKRIELIENLIRMQLEAQKQMQASVQQPTFDEVAQKHLPDKVEFEAMDGLMVTGNLYEIGSGAPVILLCHQAGYNRVEYMDICSPIK